MRTLHYYDEIGLFKPTKVTEAGYRLYDDEALDRLGQILVFRELDLPLADIKLIMENPTLDHGILEKQREMLLIKIVHCDLHYCNYAICAHQIMIYFCKIDHLKFCVIQAKIIKQRVAFQLRKSGWKSARLFYVTKRR